MREQRTTEIVSIPVSRSGVIVAEGYGLKLYVHRGVLHIEERNGDQVRRAELIRSTARGSRVILLGQAGMLSVEALRWMADAQVGFAVIDASPGRVVASGASPAPDKPPLRRAQALVAGTPAGLEIAKHLIERKLSGQLGVIRDRFPEASEAGELISVGLARVGSMDSVVRLRSLEARAAEAYWGAWRNVRLRFVAKDQDRVPEHWKRFPGRGSPIAGTGPRAASCPLNALLNLGFALGEIEARIVCETLGLDPGLGIVHTDQPARGSMALDLLEPIRPTIEGWAFDAVASHVFRKADFYETRRGVFRVGTDLARAAAEQMPTLRRALAPVTEEVALAVARSGDRPVNVATKLTEVRRREGRGRKTTRAVAIRTCLFCGVELLQERRKVCDECLPEYERGRTEKLAAAGKATLAAMRASADDPAQSLEARAKRSDASRERMRAIRAWEREHGRGLDVHRYQQEIVPVIEGLSVATLMARTGLSQHYCWQVRAGRKRLHPMHWAKLLASPR